MRKSNLSNKHDMSPTDEQQIYCAIMHKVKIEKIK